VNVIEVDGLTKDFAAGPNGARIRALDGVTLRVAEGEVVGLLGPNGSGKSTLLKIILGLLPATAGECRLFGATGAPAGVRAAVGYLPEAPDFGPHLSGFEVVWFHARLSGLPRAGLTERVERALAAVGLAGAGHRRAAAYSRGMRQRLGLAQALVHDPRLVILDEPMAGLDPVAIEETGRLIGRLKAQGRTVLLSSHLLGQVAAICDRIALLDRGRLILEGRVVELARGGAETVLRVDRLPEAALGELRQWLEARGAKLQGAEAGRLDLERAFLAAVQGDGAGKPGVP
jgi:ABC-2 type transport system ATP-binding protein